MKNTDLQSSQQSAVQQLAVRLANKPFTVMIADAEDKSNVYLLHVEALTCTKAIRVAAESLHKDHHYGWSDKDIEEDGKPFNLNDYVTVAVFSGHLKNLC